MLWCKRRVIVTFTLPFLGGISMSGRTPIPAEINNHNFEALYRKEPHARTRIRYLCMSHIQAGKSFSEIAQMLKVSRETVRMWVKRFAEEGLTGLSERPGRGAKQDYRLKMNLSSKRLLKPCKPPASRTRRWACNRSRYSRLTPDALLCCLHP